MKIVLSYLALGVAVLFLDRQNTVLAATAPMLRARRTNQMDTVIDRELKTGNKTVAPTGAPTATQRPTPPPVTPPPATVPPPVTPRPTRPPVTPLPQTPGPTRPPVTPPPPTTAPPPETPRPTRPPVTPSPPTTAPPPVTPRPTRPPVTVEPTPRPTRPPVTPPPPTTAPPPVTPSPTRPPVTPTTAPTEVPVTPRPTRPPGTPPPPTTAPPPVTPRPTRPPVTPTAAPTEAPVATLPPPVTIAPTEEPTEAPVDLPCSVCLPGTTLTNPNAVVRVPPELGLTETFTTCQLLDNFLAADVVESDDRCLAVRGLYQEECGCVPIEIDTLAPTTAPTDSPTRPPVAPTAAPTEAPVTPRPTRPPVAPTAAPTEAPVTPRPTRPPVTPTAAPTEAPVTLPPPVTIAPTEEPTEAPVDLPCSVCLPGTTLTNPNAVVRVPPELGLTETFTTCQLLDNFLAADVVESDDRCLAVRGLYQEECGCVPIEIDTLAPTTAPTESPTAATVTPTQQPVTPPPVVGPTAAPTETPTSAPVTPTEQPVTPPPVVGPTTSPTETPTIAPTESPTEAPVATDAPLPTPTVPPVTPPPTDICDSICLPGTELTKPDTIIEIPPELDEAGIGFTTCQLLDDYLASNSGNSEVLEGCRIAQELYQDECGCLPPFVPTVAPATDAPATEEPVPACSTVCNPGFAMTMPNAVIQVPEGIAIGVIFTTCGLLDEYLGANFVTVPAETCTDISENYQDVCGCVEVEEVTPTEAPVPQPVPPCSTVCNEGTEMTMPNAAVRVPPGLDIGVLFTTCDLLDEYLNENYESISEATCTDIAENYQEPCGCESTSVFICSLCGDADLTLPNNSIQVPTDWFEEGVTTCGSLSAFLETGPDVVTEETCAIVQADAVTTCGCGGSWCAVCEAGFEITLPNAAIRLPPDILGGVLFTSCGLLDDYLTNNLLPSDGEVCIQIQGQYNDECGCQPIA